MAGAQVFDMPTEIRIKIPDVTTFPPAEGVNFVAIDRVGADVQMLFGYVDLHTMVRALSGNRDKPPTLSPTITRRLAMGANTFANLKAQVDDVYAGMLKSGDVPDIHKPETAG